MSYILNFWISIIVISLVGTLSHFLYDWTHHNRIIGLFAAVNESTWEHIKIALTAALLWGLYDGYFYGDNPNYFLAKLASLLVITITIPAVFYFYRLFAKKSILVIDIGIFYLAILLAQLTFFGILSIPSIPFAVQYLSCIGLFIFFGCYMTLTLSPIKSFIFKDPLNGKYGFRAHSDPYPKSTKSTKKSTKK